MTIQPPPHTPTPHPTPPPTPPPPPPQKKQTKGNKNVCLFYGTNFRCDWIISDIPWLSWHISNHYIAFPLFIQSVVFRRTSKTTSKLHVSGFCEGNPPVTDGFTPQRASSPENVSISWRHFEVLSVSVKKSSKPSIIDPLWGRTISGEFPHKALVMRKLFPYIIYIAVRWGSCTRA